MAADLGTDVLALDDLPDPEMLGSGALNVAYALARRITTPSGALDEIGDPGPYDSLDVRDYLGARVDRALIDDLQAQIEQVMGQDERVLSVTATVAFNEGALTVTAGGESTAGPFRLVLTVDQVNTTIFAGGS